jgi:(p)ppGpp synthase/HD superfamily hydrolase
MKQVITDFKIIEDYARRCYNEANCTYGNGDYFIHINMVVHNINKYSTVFKHGVDFITTFGAGFVHDCIEDAKQTYNDITEICGTEVADITLGVTDVPAKNRLMKHLLTMGKTVRDYRAIVLKMCDILANATFAKNTQSSMYKKYVNEYQYRKPIFKAALDWYKSELNFEELDKLWKELDEVHTI